MLLLSAFLVALASADDGCTPRVSVEEWTADPELQKTIIRGNSVPDKTSTSIICRAGSNDEEADKLLLHASLANRIYRAPGAYCVYDLEDVHRAYHWQGQPDKKCWKIRTEFNDLNTLCWKPNTVKDRQSATNARARLCDICHGLEDYYNQQLCHWDWGLEGYCTHTFTDWMDEHCPKTCCEIGRDVGQ